ncbi:MAG: response regulator transcription factor [Sandaracinaceae bacterium]|jgi:two-component system OmpR family response regulator|nr:response regulator transcription factor [Sandaracinaceae bacterium]
MNAVPQDRLSLLLVEDDERLARFVMEFLEKHSVTTTLVSDGNEAIREATKTNYDAVVLDIMLPGKDGIEVCRSLRERSSVPILFVTARTEESDRVHGFDVGADDYVTKPFSPKELLARVRALVRRARGEVGPKAAVLSVGSLTLDLERRLATRSGKALDLSSREIELLRIFMENTGRVLPRERIVELLHGSAEDAFDRSIDVAVHRLRQKLLDDPSKPQLLKTVRGAGYVLVDGELE